MKTINAVIYWFGGVLVPSLEQAAALVTVRKPWNSLDPELRTQLHRAAEDVTLGKTSPEQFSRRAIECSNSPMEHEEFVARLTAETEIRSDVMKVIRQLPEGYERWLLCDYPLEWLEAIAQRARLTDVIRGDRFMRPGDWGMARLVPDLFYNLASHVGEPIDTCLIIDAVTARAVAATRHQLSSTIFVDARRLARDYVLREMMEKTDAA